MITISRAGVWLCLIGTFLAAQPAIAQRADIPLLSTDPYQGAIVVGADGEVLFEDKADAPGYPASMVKLMNLLLILEGVDRGTLNLQDPVVVTAEAAGMGGSQVFLKEGEVFSIEELLYAMMIQSANDAAVALALKVAGTKDGFVERMNRRAAELGMRKTLFHSVHGLPPARGQEPDVSTPRDMARLCLALLKRPDVLAYTSVTKRPFRAESPKPFIMENHNRLLGAFEGCDGLKTGYIKAGGYSVAATAVRNGHRVVAVVMGSLNRETRDAKARELLTLGLNQLAARPPPAVLEAPEEIPAPVAEKEPPASPRRAWKWGLVIVLILGGTSLVIWTKRPRYHR
ncbi:MAG: D-alanyl-D-alanine carboxypeptidase [Verrucomicrobia bacterium]|nr:D-alanyl-D-alanine carboxypeptidase [Verrucomicrobiota bacterium]